MDDSYRQFVNTNMMIVDFLLYSLLLLLLIALKYSLSIAVSYSDWYSETNLSVKRFPS